MALSTNEHSVIRTDLAVLHEAASAIDGWDGNQGRTFIEVGEYGVALDEIAHAYLDARKTVPCEMFKTFEKLAMLMDLAQEAELDGVARLRAQWKGGRF
jgi:hypothetical protein